jgi:hypothetical protein
MAADNCNCSKHFLPQRTQRTATAKAVVKAPAVSVLCDLRVLCGKKAL